MVGVSALKGLLNEHAEITSLPEQSIQNKPENMSLSAWLMISPAVNTV
jgi:arsenite-transporting ATPase